MLPTHYRVGRHHHHDKFRSDPNTPERGGRDGYPLGDPHVAVLDGATGAVLGTREVAATRQGYALALEYATSFGSVTRWGIEGTNSYGAGVTRHLREAGQVVREVIRPNRAERRWRGKSDPLDAITAVRCWLTWTVSLSRRTLPGRWSPSGC